ncbi:MAG: hypothetical protein WD099_10160 [Dongiaceae bacterium]
MRNVSHKAAATIALGLLTDDLFGALIETPSAASPESENHAAFADYVAAGRWLGEIDRSDRSRKPAARRASVRN